MMKTQISVRLGELPLPLAMELQELRHRFSGALREAAAGQFDRESELRALSGHLGHILAREARRPSDRRGMSMREVSLAVARLFPELREWSVQTALRDRMERSRPLPVEQAS